MGRKEGGGKRKHRFREGNGYVKDEAHIVGHTL